MSLVKDETGVLQKTDEDLIGEYADQGTLVGRSVQRQVKNISTCFVAMAVCIRRSIRKRCLKEISKLDYFREHQRRN